MLEKVCISASCRLKKDCYLWHSYPEQCQAWISPEKTGDACPYFHERLNYGVGKVEEQND